MIYVRDKGQMCNNLLQFGHVYAFARSHGRKAFSMRFAYKYPWFRISKQGFLNPVRYALAKGAAAIGLMPVVSYDTPGEVSAEKEKRILDSRTVMVQGWEVRFYEDFLTYADEIRHLFSFLPAVESAVSPLLPEGKDTLRIGLHVRRGDYARWNGGRYLFSDEQYAAVAAKIAALHPERKITLYICSNDPKLDIECYRNALPNATIITPKGNPAEDLCLLSHCDLLAGAPSTYSLTAAFYHDIPLYWIENPDDTVTPESFGKFETLFRHIK